jgi:hypothetical protein
MKRHIKLACLSALIFCVAPAAGNAYPLDGSTLRVKAVEARVTRIGCYDDCWHDSWRSHYRWGSHHHEHWHNRWRSHFRWGSYGGYGHSREYSHYRWGSYHRLWRPYIPYDGED